MKIVTIKSFKMVGQKQYTYAEDEEGNKYQIKQLDTGRVFNDAIDLLPTKHIYEATANMIEKGNI